MASKKYGYMATIGADTSGLTAALHDVEAESRKISSELREVNNNLKFEDGGAVALQQKYDLLQQAITQTANKLELLKKAESDVNAAAESGKISAENQRAFQRELDSTANKLERYKKQADETNNELDRIGKEAGQAANNTENLSKEVDGLGNSIDNAGKSTITFGDIFKANILSDVVMSGLRRLKDEFVDFAKQGIQLASDLTEVQNVVDTTFGDSSGEIDSWAKNAATAFGMSELAAKQYTGTLGAMLKSQGITNDSVVELSENLVGLAGDMASFYNLDIETAFEKIRSGISGETEPLKQLGINMSVANMEAYALAEGIEKPWRKMSQQEQTMLRYNYLLKVTADAQGDFVRTLEDSYANQDRVKDLIWQNLSAELGEKLLPVALELTQLVSSSAPSIMDNIEGIGDMVVTLSKAVIDHREAILSLITAYLSFKGAMTIGNTITTAVNAYKALTTATQTATAAQQANNAAVAANPYVLLISALVAVGAAIGTYVLQLDSVIEKEKDIKKAADDVIASSEAEARTVEAKAERYNRLYDEYQKTGVATGEMIELAKELQELSPGTIKLIDEETGAYNALSDSIKDVITQIRLKGIEQAKSESLESYYSNITEYYKAQANAYQNYSKAVANISNETLAELEKGSEGAYKEFFENTSGVYGEFGTNRDAAMYAQGLDYEAFQAYNDAIYQRDLMLDSTNAKIAENERLIEETSASYDKLAESVRETSEAETESQSAGNKNYWGEYFKEQNSFYTEQREKIYENAEEEQKIRDENLNAFVADLDKKLSLRKVSEQEYYDALHSYLVENQDKESVEWFKQLGRWEDYNQKKNDEAVKAAEKQQAAQKKLEEDSAAERIKIIKSYWDNVTQIRKKGDISEEDEYKLKSQIVKKYCDENENTWDEYYIWLYDYTKKKEEEIADAKLEAWDKNAKKLSDNLKKSYDDLKQQKEKVRAELMNIDLSETVTDKNGKEIEVLKDLDKEIAKIDRYTKSRQQLINTGISESLLKKIDEMSYEDGSRQRMIDTILSLSDSKRQEYYNDWERLNQKADQAEADIFKDKTDELNKEAADSIKDIFAVPAEAYDQGVEAAQSYVQGIIDAMNEVNNIPVLGMGFVGSAYTSNQSTGGSPQQVISTSTPIIIKVNDTKTIKTTIQEIIDQGTRSGGNEFNL